MGRFSCVWNLSQWPASECQKYRNEKLPKVLKRWSSGFKLLMHSKRISAQGGTNMDSTFQNSQGADQGVLYWPVSEIFHTLMNWQIDSCCSVGRSQAQVKTKDFKADIWKLKHVQGMESWAQSLHKTTVKRDVKFAPFQAAWSCNQVKKHCWYNNHGSNKVILDSFQNCLWLKLGQNYKRTSSHQSGQNWRDSPYVAKLRCMQEDLK